jgi:hypothetical protein
MIPFTETLIKLGIYTSAAVTVLGGLAAIAWAVHEQREWDPKYAAAVREVTGGRGGASPTAMAVIGPAFCLGVFWFIQNWLFNAPRGIMKGVVGTILASAAAIPLFK